MAPDVLDRVGDAVTLTRDFVFPFSLGRWARLAVVAGFVTVGVTPPTPTASWRVERPLSEFPPVGGADVPAFSFGPRLAELALGVLALAVVLGVVFLFVGSVMEFVLLAALRDDALRIRRSWRRHWRRGLRLFGFRLLLGAPLVVLGVAFVALPFLRGARGGNPLAAWPDLLLAVPALVVLGAVVGVVNGFTTAFVAPVMLQRECGVVAGWRRFWPVLTGNAGTYLTYALVAVALAVVLGTAVGVVVGVVTAFLFVPAVLLSVPGLLLTTVSPTLAAVYFAAVGLLFVVAVVAVVAGLEAPVQVYVRYFSLLVLGDTDDRLDLVPEKRAAVTEDSTRG